MTSSRCSRGGFTPRRTGSSCPISGNDTPALCRSFSPTMARDRIAVAGPRVCLVRQTFFTIPAALRADIDHLLRSATFSPWRVSTVYAPLVRSLYASSIRPSFVSIHRAHICRAPTTLPRRASLRVSLWPRHVGRSRRIQPAPNVYNGIVRSGLGADRVSV